MTILNNTQVVDRTQAITKIPMKNNLLSALGLFVAKSVSGKALTFDVREKNIAVLDDQLRNTDQKNGVDPTKYDIHTLAIPHYPIETAITSDQLAGIRGFGKDNTVAIETAVAEELEFHADSHDNHLEYLQSLMLCRGQIDTTYYGMIDSFKEFGVDKVSGVIDTTKDIAAQLRKLTEISKTGLKNGGRAKGYICLCDADFFEGLVASPSIAQAYSINQSANNPFLNTLGANAEGYQIWTFGNVTFVVYSDVFTKRDGTTIQPLGNGQAVLFPRAAIGKMFFGSKNTLTGLNSTGSKRYATTFRDPKDRFIEVDSEQNTLVINQNIAACVYLTLKAAK